MQYSILFVSLVINVKTAINIERVGVDIGFSM
jgi:hypothetical protein